MKYLHDEACKNEGFHLLRYLLAFYDLQRSPVAIYDLHERQCEKKEGENVEDKQRKGRKGDERAKRGEEKKGIVKEKNQKE